MASEKVVKRAPQASGLITTSVPRIPFSYRWVVTDAKTLVERLTNVKSPTFTVSLPLKSESAEQQDQTTLWHLHIERQYTGGSSPTWYFNMYLYQTPRPGDEAKFAKLESKSKIYFSDVTFSLINLETEESVYSYHYGNTEVTLGKSSSSYCASSQFAYSNLDKYLCQGTLTIQVTATILCFTDTIETQERERKASEDNVLAGIRSLLSDTLFSDVTIKCGSAEFKAHKAILASQSPVFKKMLETDMKEQRSSVIEISDIDGAVLSDMLAYVYTGTAPNMDTLAKDLFNVANKYEFSQLFMMCENKLKSTINATNVIELLILADLHRSSYLKKACLNYIYHNSATVYASSQWKELKKNCESHGSLIMEIMEYRP